MPLKVGIKRDASLARHHIKKVQGRLQRRTYKKWVAWLERSGLIFPVLLQCAVHILAWAYIECDVRYHLHNKTQRIVFLGDLSVPRAPIRSARRPLYAVNLVVLEGTYADRLHEERFNREVA